MRILRSLALAVVAFTLFGTASGARASKIYFIEFDSDGVPGSGTQYHFSLNRANLDGSGRKEVVDDMGNQPDYASLVVDGGVVYWNELGGVTRAATTGGTLLPGPVRPPNQRVAAALYDRVIDAAGEYVYFPGDDGFGGMSRIIRATPGDLAPDGEFHYQDPQDLVRTRHFSPNVSIALDEARGKIYWAGAWSGGETGLLQRANLADGSGVETLLEGFASDDYTIDLAIDPEGGKLYWANSSLHVIQRSNLDGSGLEDVLTDVWASSVALELTPVPEPSMAVLWSAVGALLLRRRAVVRRG